MTIPKGRNANNAERLEVVLPEKGSVAVRFKANCADPFVPRSPKWTHANGVETGPEVVIEFHKAGLQAIAFDTGNKEHMDVWVDVKPHSFKRTTTLHPDLVFRSAAKALNDALANSPTVVPRITPPSGTVSRTYYGWVELANSPKTFEQVSYNGGLDPAFGAALRVRTPNPVPVFMRKYVNAEAYLQAGVELSLPMIEYSYMANKDETGAIGKWSSGCDGKASFVVSLGAEGRVGDWASIDVVGDARGTLIAKTVINDGRPGFDINYEVKPLVVKLKISWGGDGGVEYTDEWEVFERMTGQLIHWDLGEAIDK